MKTHNVNSDLPLIRATEAGLAAHTPELSSIPVPLNSCVRKHKSYYPYWRTLNAQLPGNHIKTS